jgi:hypothetical protein
VACLISIAFGIIRVFVWLEIKKHFHFASLHDKYGTPTSSPLQVLVYGMNHPFKLNYLSVMFSIVKVDEGPPTWS